MVTAGHTPGNAWSEDPSIEAVPEATGAQMMVPDEMELEDGERPLALYEAVARYEQQVGNAGSPPSCHSLMRDEWGNRCSLGRIVQSWME